MNSVKKILIAGAFLLACLWVGGCFSAATVQETFEKTPLHADSVGAGEMTWYWWHGKDGTVHLQPAPMEMPCPKVTFPDYHDTGKADKPKGRTQP